jgi:hypothetical protein
MLLARGHYVRAAYALQWHDEFAPALFEFVSRVEKI